MREKFRLLLLSALVCGALTGCAKEEVDTNFRNLLAQSDKGTVFLYSQDRADPYERVRELGPEELKELEDIMIMDGKRRHDCDPDGAIFFYNDKEIIMKMRFSLDDECSSGVYLDDGRLLTRNISVKGKTLLRSKLALGQLARE